MSVNDPRKLTHEQALAFHNLQEEGKKLSDKGKLIEALEKLEEALSICETDKVQRRILKLKTHLGHPLVNSNISASEAKLDSSKIGSTEEFNRLKLEGRKLAQEGCFHEAIKKLRECELISPSERVQKWIKKLEILLQEESETENKLVKDPKDSSPQSHTKRFNDPVTYEQDNVFSPAEDHNNTSTSTPIRARLDHPLNKSDVSVSEAKLNASKIDSTEKFNRLKSEGKKLAQEGCFHEAIEKLRQCESISPSAKVQKWIRKLEILMQEESQAASKLVKDPKDLSPQSYEKFSNLKKSAMQLSLNGKFKDALQIFEQALQICESSDIKDYIKEMKKIIHSQAEKLATFEGLAEKGQKLLKEGRSKESLTTLKEAYSVCPSPSVLQMIKSLEDKGAAMGNSASPDLVKRPLHYSSETEEPEVSAVPKIFSTRISDIPHFKRPHDPVPYEKGNFFSPTKTNTTASTPNRGSFTAEAAVSTPSPTNLNPKVLAEFRNFQDQAKQCASEGKMKNALEHLYEAKSICQTPKLLKKIKTLEDYLKNNSDEDCDKMFEICEGFSIYHEIYKKLYPYQREGVIWMWGLHKKRKGGVLGDDMGLGKTFQVIAFLSGMIDADAVKTILIIMPVSLLENWKREFNKWCPGISVHEFHGGSKKERERSLNRVQRRGNVLLTSYGMVLTSLESLTHIDGRQFVWDYVILDEGHKIKNPTKSTKAVHDIPSRNRIVLTGTPVQNNLRELWALYDFSHQGTLLGSLKTFKMQYENIIIRSREKDATLGEKRLGMEMAENLKRLIKPYFLRRTKSEVLQNKSHDADELTNDLNNLSISNPMKLKARKNDLIVWLKMCDTQSQIYSDFLQSDTVKLILMTKKSPLVQLTVLKKICDHPRLLSQKACLQLGLNGEISEEELQSEIENESTSTSSIENVSDDTLMKESVKLKFLIDLLENLRANNHRTLVFSLSRKILDIIQRILVNKKWKVLRIDGTINKMEERERRIQLFQNNSSYPVFLLTTQVGGVGITLTAADRCVIYDPSWNPATDAQAVDRVYRIGQKRNVVVYRLITCATVEEKIYRRQIFKDSITRQATTNTTDPHRYFSKQELRELFSIDDPNYSATQVQLSELHSAERKTDVSLDEHIAFLYSLDIFGISDHDLMFSKEIRDETEDHCEAAVSHEFIKQTVNSAQMLIQTESSVVEEGIRLAGSFKRPFQEAIITYKKNTEKDKYRPPVFPEIVDLTNDGQSGKFDKLQRDVLVTPHEKEDFEIGNYSPTKGTPELRKKLSRSPLDALENIIIFNSAVSNNEPEIRLHADKNEENKKSHSLQSDSSGKDSENISFSEISLKIDQVRSPLVAQNKSRASLAKVEENINFKSLQTASKDRDSGNMYNFVQSIDEVKSPVYVQNKSSASFLKNDVKVGKDEVLHYADVEDTDTQSTVKIDYVESPVYMHNKSRSSQGKDMAKDHLDLPGDINEAENVHSSTEKTPSAKARSHFSMGVEVEEVNISDKSSEKIGDSPNHERSQLRKRKSLPEESEGDSMPADEKVMKYFESMTEETHLVESSDVGVEDMDVPDPNAVATESVESPSKIFVEPDDVDERVEPNDVDERVEPYGDERINDDDEEEDNTEQEPRTSSPAFDKSIISDLEIQVDDNMFPLLGSFEEDYVPRTSFSRRKSCARRATVVISDSDTSSQQSGPASANDSGEVIVGDSDSEELSEAESDLSTTPEPNVSTTSVIENSIDESHSITQASFDISNYSDKSLSGTVNDWSSNAGDATQDMQTLSTSDTGLSNKPSEFKPKLFGSELERTPDKTIETVKRITPLRIHKEYNKSPHPSPFEMEFNSSNPLMKQQQNASNRGSDKSFSPKVNEESPILRAHKPRKRQIVESDSEDSS